MQIPLDSRITIPKIPSQSFSKGWSLGTGLNVCDVVGCLLTVFSRFSSLQGIAGT